MVFEEVLLLPSSATGDEVVASEGSCNFGGEKEEEDVVSEDTNEDGIAEKEKEKAVEEEDRNFSPGFLAQNR